MIAKLLVLLSTAAPVAAFAFAPHAPRSSPSRSSLALAPHDAESKIGSSWAGARYGDEFPSTGHWSECETEGTTSANAMDTRGAPAVSSPLPGGMHFERTETHGTTSANAMDARGAAPSSVFPWGVHYSASETHERSESLGTTAWSGADHADRGNDAYEWSGARFGDYAPISKRASPTASKWHE